MTILAAALAWLLAPATALACATCLDSAYGDRGFNWAFASMMAAPLGVALGLLGGLVWACRRFRDDGAEEERSR